MDRGEPPGGLEMRRLRQELRLGAQVGAQAVTVTAAKLAFMYSDSPL